MRNVLVAATALMLSACVSTGKKVNMEKVNQFKEGRTTYDEVLVELGEPTSSTFNSDGTRSISYSYAQTQARLESYIPYVGAFLGGSDHESSFVHMLFDGDGILMRYTANSGKSSTGTGLLSGQRQ
ncbi:hypothetical protein ACN28E_01750 [Archangium lansingense]|uniref:hypothetical protein n=1 Tax=Archangium lansingense TaxID=2995310 RepID=UPI003B7F5641